MREGVRINKQHIFIIISKGYCSNGQRVTEAKFEGGKVGSTESNCRMFSAGFVAQYKVVSERIWYYSFHIYSKDKKQVSGFHELFSTPVMAIIVKAFCDLEVIFLFLNFRYHESGQSGQCAAEVNVMCENSNYLIYMSITTICK